MAKASMATRDELIKRNRAKYQKSSKKGKGLILDGFCLNTGLSRDRAARLLSGNAVKLTPSTKGKKRGRKPLYDDSAVSALKQMWAFMDFACGKRLAFGMEDMLNALIRFGEVDYCTDTIKQLKRMSPATIDRLLAKEKALYRLRGISTTKPGTLLKKDIPLRLGTEWNDAVPGYVEIDLVAHCGRTTAGEYLNTLTVTDVCTGWTETMAVLNKARKHVFEALMQIEERLPFPYLGIDSDNGAEFINAHLFHYCKEQGICFTRSRTYQKNDNCYVEQKNWSVVRRNIGYGRYEGEDALRVLNAYYALLRLHVNFFLPSVKLVEKTRDGGRIKKRYSKAMTPYRRVLREDFLSPSVKEELTQAFHQINPAALRRAMILLLEKLVGMKASS